MNELITITRNEAGNDIVSARELYEFLGFNTTHWSKWYKKNIIKNDFAIENNDYSELALSAKTPKNGRPTKDFALTLDFAKRISMMAKTEKGEEARRYFLKCEEVAKNPILKLDRSALAQMVIESENERLRAEERIELQKEQLQIQAPKVKFVNEVLESKSTYLTNVIAKHYGISAITLNRILSGKRIQYKQDGTWLLYSKYQGKEYTKTKTATFQGSDGSTRTNISTVWTEKGRMFIDGVLKNELLTVA